MSSHPITVHGNLVEQPHLSKFAGDAYKISFRLASSRRYFDTENSENPNGEWRQIDTLFLSVEAWGTLAHNARRSLFKGAPVIVTGSLVTEEWSNPDNSRSSRVVLKASRIGFDLNKYIVGSRKASLETNPEGVDIPGAQPLRPIDDFVDTDHTNRGGVSQSQLSGSYGSAINPDLDAASDTADDAAGSGPRGKQASQSAAAARSAAGEGAASAESSAGEVRRTGTGGKKAEAAAKKAESSSSVSVDARPAMAGAV